MIAPRLGQAARYLVKAARCLDPRPTWRVTPRTAAAHDERSLLAQAAEYNRAAEKHWHAIAADPAARRDALDKPLSALREAPAVFSHVGLTLDALDLGLGHTVLDFGAGSCWLSLILNRLGVRTISMDVAPTALELGREVFRSDSHARPELEPRFMAYDGRRVPLPEATVDRAVCFDSFHHVPNRDEILQELYRVLKVGGRLVLVEPGEGHALTSQSRFDALQHGILESELLLEDLLARAGRAGFLQVLSKPYADPKAITISAKDCLRLIDGDDSVYPMHVLRDDLRKSQVVILLKGEPSRDSRNPHRLHARITPIGAKTVRGPVASIVELPLQIENLGDTRWLSRESPDGGYVFLGGHLLDAQGCVLQRGFFSFPLPGDVAPGQTVDLVARLPMPEPPGRYRLTLDLADQKVAWFEQCGSTVTEIELLASVPDSRAPHRLRAQIDVLQGRPAGPLAAGTGLPLRLRLENTGDTRWLADPSVGPGVVRLGVQVRATDGSLLRRDHFRAPLPRPLDPAESIEMEVAVPVPTDRGRFVLAFDMVAELVCWFEHSGSPPTLVTIETA